MNNKLKFLLLFLVIVYSVACAETVGQLMRKAKDNYDNKRYTKAKEEAFEIIKKDANLLEAHKIYVKSCKHLSEKTPAEMDSCITFYKDKTATMMFYDKNKPVLLFALGFACLQADKIKDAEEAFNQSIKLSPKAPYVKDIEELSRKHKFTIDMPVRSLGEDIKLWVVIVSSFIILFIVWFVYKGYSDRKIGEQQVAKIKKDRSVDFFGRKRY